MLDFLSAAATWMRGSSTLKRWMLVLGAIILLVVGHCAHAATPNQALACMDSDIATHNTADTCNAKYWTVINANDVVLSVLDSSLASGSHWNDPTMIYRRAGDLPSTAWVLVCSTLDAEASYGGSGQCPTGGWVALTSVYSAAGTGTATVSWTAVTTDTSGNAANLTGYNVYRGSDANSLSPLTTVGATTLTYVDSGLAVGTWYYAVSAVNSAGAGVKSAIVSKTISPAQAVPSGVTGVTIAATSAYDLVKSNDKLTAKVIGTVTANTKCDLTQPVLGYYVVPRASVTLSGTSTRPQVIVAKCD